MTLDGIARALVSAGIPADVARHEAMLLISRFAGVSPARILADRGRDYGEREFPLLAAAAEERMKRRPLQYILGEWEFCGMRFRVNEDCLIPRPDTETVAERAAQLLPPGGRFLDLCTGSGCIAAAICRLGGDKVTRGRGFAVELFPKTAELARENLAALGYAEYCTVLTGDLRDPDLPLPAEPFDLIVSNPPYIARDEMDALEPELAAEPRAALTDEGDGLSLIRAILSGYRDRLAPDGVMLIEHGWKQAPAVKDMAEALGYRYSPVYDLGGNLRAAEIRG